MSCSPCLKSLPINPSPIFKQLYSSLPSSQFWKLPSPSAEIRDKEKGFKLCKCLSDIIANLWKQNHKTLHTFRFVSGKIFFASYYRDLNLKTSFKINSIKYSVVRNFRQGDGNSCIFVTTIRYLGLIQIMDVIQRYRTHLDFFYPGFPSFDIHESYF